MSPVPIIELQRRLTLAGAIRAGGEKQPKAPGRKLEAFRLTSRTRSLMEQAALLYGGEVTPWEGPNGPEYQVYTQAQELPVLIMPGYSLQQTYELWEGATKQERRCDGLELDDGSPCLCKTEGVDRCDIYTRLVVCLPELDTVLGWRLISRGANAARELPYIFILLERYGAATFVPAKLRLDQRRGVMRQEGKEPQVVRFVVPTLDLGVGYLALAAPANGPDGSRELPAAGFTPAPRREATVEQALSAARPSPQPGGQGAAALGPPEPAPAAPEEQTAPVEEPQPQPQTAKATKQMKTKLDILVTRLRERGDIQTKHLWDAVAKVRGLGGEELVLTLGGYDEDLVLHWSPLRESLTRPEAVGLLDRLEALDKKTSEQASPDEAGQEASEESAAEPPEGPTPYNEFPPGY